MTVLAIIPARGGSKGIAGKNLKLVAGVSLVERAVRAALASSLIDRVIVSTDDATIAANAKSAGAEVMDRSAALSGDDASSESALLDVLDRVDRVPRVIVFLQPTSPFIDPFDLDEAIARVRDGVEDVVFSGVESFAFLWEVGAEGALATNHDKSVRPRRQDRAPQYLETGAFYVMDAAGFRAARFRFFGSVGMQIVDERSAIEIDTPFDLVLANAIAEIEGRNFWDLGIDVDAIATDFDGVHTDDRVFVGPEGMELVIANRADGMGVRMLRERGVPFLILSSELNPVVSARGAKLEVEVRQGIFDKASALRTWAAEIGVPLDRIAYVGNDINDLGALGIAGWPIAVADANPDVLAIARTVLRSNGGDGAVRELADRVLATKTHPQSTSGDKS